MRTKFGITNYSTAANCYFQPIMDIGNRLSKRLKGLIRERRTTAEKLAYESGVSKGNLSDILRGKRSPTLRTLDKIAKNLGVEVRDLL
jgi:transcriptional regulator with XRE-family HTH domain